MYKLMGGKGNRSFRVYWALEEMGLDYEVIEGGPRSDEVRALNPSGKVPVLVADGEAISDSSAIIQFLADKHDMLTYKAGTVKRAQQDSYLHFVNDEMDGVLWTAARNSFILPEDKRVPAIKPTLKWEYARSMKTLARRLGDSEFLMGEKFTVPDIIAGHLGNWAKNAGFEYDAPVVTDYMDRMAARPAYVKLRAQ